ncbi:hypothetical protein ACFV42_23145 [Streptomyces solisilvae]|uniref:hypothetical protein n=1 Tax=Streptomyces malaysiensis TaxID=92644 RepID=UPI00368DA6E7
MTKPAPNLHGAPQFRIPRQPSGYVMSPVAGGSDSLASAAAASGGRVAPERRQSFWVHFWLGVFTLGIGNVVYAWRISKWNADRGRPAAMLLCAIRHSSTRDRAAQDS